MRRDHDEIMMFSLKKTAHEGKMKGAKLQAEARERRMRFSLLALEGLLEHRPGIRTRSHSSFLYWLTGSPLLLSLG